MFNSAGLRSSLLFTLFSSVLIVIVFFILVQIWFPGELSAVLGINRILVVLACCGAISAAMLCTAVSWRRKSQKDLRRGFVQAGILISVVTLVAVKFLWDVRPVYLGFEGDRFRIVETHEIVYDRVGGTLLPRPWSVFSGPQMLGVKLLTGSDPGYTESVLLAIEGVHPSFRQSRWVPYSEQKADVLKNLKPLRKILTPEAAGVASTSLQSRAEEFGFLPLVGRHVQGDWVAVIRKLDGQLETVLPVDGW